jgi:hypothetical protein
VHQRTGDVTGMRKLLRSRLSRAFCRWAVLPGLEQIGVLIRKFG